MPLLWFSVNLLSPELMAQRLPKTNIIETPELSDSLCVSNLFQSNMVLQRDKPIRIWGWATPGETITVSVAGKEARAEAAANRRWEVELAALEASATPQTMIVAGADQKLELTNILIGDVWVLGGQSNMEFELTKVENGALEIVSANYPEIRVLTIPYAQGPEKKLSFPRLNEWSDWFGRHFRKGYWDECSPEIAKDLSAIGYVFARRVHKASQVPIGVIDASRGGTTVETWTPLAWLEKMESPTTQAKLAEFAEHSVKWDAKADLAARVAQHEQWLERQTKEGKPIPEDRQQAPSDLRPGPIGDLNYPGHCYAGMIAPLEGLAIKGAIFHQGYNNAFDGSRGADMYLDVFPKMIEAWRAAFRDAQMPFGILSLCTEGDPQTRDNYCEKMFNAGIEIRAAHYTTFLKFYQNGDKNIGYASTYDLRRRWYHPQVKIPAGERIARWALATQYGFDRELEWKPPMLVSFEKREGSLLLVLDREVGDPLEAKIEGFAIAGTDRVFHPADVAYLETGKDDQNRPKFDRKQLVLSSPLVANPIHFRFAWGRNPLANLQALGNKDLPFATQKSDNWRMEEVPAGILEDSASVPPSRQDNARILEALRQQDRSRRTFEAQQWLESVKK